MLGLQNSVVEKMLQVKAVLGTIKPADVSTKRISISRLESLMFLFGLLSTSQNQLVGSDDPGRIFRHYPQQAASTSSRNSQLHFFFPSNAVWLPPGRSTCFQACCITREQKPKHQEPKANKNTKNKHKQKQKTKKQTTTQPQSSDVTGSSYG